MKKHKNKKTAAPQEPAALSITEETPITNDAAAPASEAMPATENESPVQDAPAEETAVPQEDAPLKVADTGKKKKKSSADSAEEATETTALAPADAIAPKKAKKEKKTDSPMSDEEAYQVLGPQSLRGHLLQMVLAPIPFASLVASFLWISLGGAPFALAFVAGVGAIVLAVFAFWALGGATNVNRRRFARAYFLSLVVLAALAGLFALLAVSYGADLSPVLGRIMKTIHSLS